MNNARKTYVLDTSTLVADPDIFAKLIGDIVIPGAVIKELDGLKNHVDAMHPKAKASRKVARTLDTLAETADGDISVGIKTSAETTIRICSRYVPIDDLASRADNRIVGTAALLHNERQGQVILVTTDRNMRNAARAHGIKAMNYPFSVRPASHNPLQRTYTNGRCRSSQAENMAFPSMYKLLILTALVVIIIVILMLGFR